MNKPIDFDLIWLEDRDKAEVIPAVLWELLETGSFTFIPCDQNRSVVVCLEDYGSRWRAWVHKPTDEERKAAEWKD